MYLILSLQVLRNKSVVILHPNKRCFSNSKSIIHLLNLLNEMVFNKLNYTTLLILKNMINQGYQSNTNILLLILRRTRPH